MRYKLPGQQRSRLIRRPLAASLIQRAQAPRGDMAFATAVAAYGQLLRGDTMMGDFTMADANRLAGNQREYWRAEFMRLAALAHSLKES